MSKHNELILAVRKQDFTPTAFAQHGFHNCNFPATFDWLEGCGLWLAPRYLLERDESFAQIIPYLLLANEDGFLCYQRGKAGGETRLHGELSIGIGGHVDASDVMWRDSKVDLAETLENAAGRECFEEVGWHRPGGFRWLGTVYDDSASVGRVHLGIVALFTVKDRLVTKAEPAIADPRVRTLDELESVAGELESWSRMVVESRVLREAKP